uniref:Uncharacterized protein n=1 Tax=Anopheles maculatus TaxID=74869 RepID=A0A182S694_9DIPT
MLKRRASKRFVLAETGEESSWNTTADNDLMMAAPQQAPPVINLETAVPSGSTSASSSFSEDNGVNMLLPQLGGASGGSDGLKVPLANNLHLSVSGGLKPSMSHGTGLGLQRGQERDFVLSTTEEFVKKFNGTRVINKV